MGGWMKDKRHVEAAGSEHTLTALSKGLFAGNWVYVQGRGRVCACIDGGLATPPVRSIEIRAFCPSACLPSCFLHPHPPTQPLPTHPPTTHTDNKHKAA